MDAKLLLGSERHEHAHDHVAAVAMDTKWLLGRAGESGATAVYSGQVWAECVRTPILALLT